MSTAKDRLTKYREIAKDNGNQHSALDVARACMEANNIVSILDWCERHASL
jgi:hypothetical protein